MSFDLPQLRARYWLLIGLAVGALIGGIQIVLGPAYLNSNARTLSQPQFERAITATPAAAFTVSDLVIHPPDESGTYWVTGRYREHGRTEFTGEFKFRAITPYAPRLAVTSVDPSRLTIGQYLSEISRRIPQARLRYGYAWYETPRATMAVWTLGSAIVIGGIWPLLLRLLSHDPIQRGTPVTEPSSDPMPKALVPIVPEAEPVPPTPAEPKEEKEYRGEFYPTRVHVDH